MTIPPPDTGQDGNVLHTVLAALAAFLLAAGGWILKRTGREPRPKPLHEGDYHRLKFELEQKFRADTRPIFEAIDAMSRSLSDETHSLRGDMQALRGEMRQIRQTVAHQGGALRGLEDRFNADGGHYHTAGG